MVKSNKKKAAAYEFQYVSLESATILSVFTAYIQSMISWFFTITFINQWGLHQVQIVRTSGQPWNRKFSNLDKKCDGAILKLRQLALGM